MDDQYVVLPGVLDRVHGRPTWTVSDRINLRHVCFCESKEDAEMVADCLNVVLAKF